MKFSSLLQHVDVLKLMSIIVCNILRSRKGILLKRLIFFFKLWPLSRYLWTNFFETWCDDRHMWTLQFDVSLNEFELHWRSQNYRQARMSVVIVLYGSQSVQIKSVCCWVVLYGSQSVQIKSVCCWNLSVYWNSKLFNVTQLLFKGGNLFFINLGRKSGNFGFWCFCIDFF